MSPQDPPARPFRPADLDGATPLPAGSTEGVRSFRPEDLAEDRPGPARSSPGPDDLAAAARAEAEAIVAAARAEADRVRETARQEGLEAGRAEAAARAAETAERLRGLCEELAGYKDRLYREARAQVLELTFALVEKLLGPLAEADRGAVVRTVEQALQLLSDRESLTVRVHPGDLQAVARAKPRILQSFDGIRSFAVIEDPSVKPGGCEVQTPTAEIDARLETRLEELVQAARRAE